jgi:hypothetical protein
MSCQRTSLISARWATLPAPPIAARSAQGCGLRAAAAVATATK